MSKCKQAYYDKYFKTNWNKNTWKRVKSFISLKTVASSVPLFSFDSDDSITDPYDESKFECVYYCSKIMFLSEAPTLSYEKILK